MQQLVNKRCYNLAPKPMDWTRLPQITTSRLALRPVFETDIDALYAIFSDTEVMRYWATPPLRDKNAATELLTEIQEGFQQQRALKWGIAQRADDALIGTATLFNLDFNHRRAEIGYALGRRYWGKGYMNEALKALIVYAFAELNFHRLEADVDPRNAGSIRTLERLGFQREGFLRERWQVGGEIQDAFFYGLLRPDWERVSGN